MFKLGRYGADHRMIDLVEERFSVLLVMSRFGIRLGFGERTVDEVCRLNGVDTATFLAIINCRPGTEPSPEEIRSVSAESFLDYLHNSHDYFLDFRLPSIRRKLAEALGGEGGDVPVAILRFFDEYVEEVRRHMQYEERTVFPYVRNLLDGSCSEEYSIGVFQQRHDAIELKLTELKSILLKYCPASDSNEMNCVLFDILLCESDLAAHNWAENHLFVPLVVELERKNNLRR